MESTVADLPIGDRLWAWFDTNKKPALWGATIAVAVGLIAWFVIWRNDEQETSASDALSNVAAEQFVSGVRPDAAAAYLKIAATYPKSSAAARASLMAAGALYTEGKYTEAQAQFERFIREHRESPLVGEALLGIASSLDAQGKTAEATTAYQDLIERHPNESFISQAKFALARLYEAQNKPEKARTLLEETVRSDPYGYLGNEAGMRLEEFKTKYPALAAPAPPPAGPQFKFEKK